MMPSSSAIDAELQAGTGAGIAAWKKPDPRAARLRNLATHTVYGIGLFVSAVALAIVWI